jgi:hypothetical protein
MRLRHLIEPLRVDAQCAAHVAQCRARPVAGHGGRERGSIASIFAIDVLDDLFAALMLEVDVDVGRFISFARDEALEENAHARRIDLRDAQAVAHGGVRSRATALAQDAVVACEVDQVGHREKVGLVAQFLDQCELVLDLHAYRIGHTLRVAQRQAPVGEGA